MFFKLSIPVFYMNESVSLFYSDGEEEYIQIKNGVCCMAEISILWLHSFTFV